MAEITKTKQATETEIVIINNLIEKIKHDGQYYANVADKQKTDLNFKQIKETLKYIKLNKLESQELSCIANFVKTYTFENTKEERIANTLKFEYNQYIKWLKIVTSTIKQKLKRFNDIIKINDAYIIETDAYDFSNEKQNITLFDLLEN